MIAIQRILCPTDLTTESDEALHYAVALSSVYNAKLFILYCRETATHRNGNGGNAQSVETEPLFIESLAPHLGLKSVSELNWEGLVAENAGDVGKTIVHEAAKHEVDLIVMRSRRRPHAASLLGSGRQVTSRLWDAGKLDQNDVSLLRHRLRDVCWHKESYRLNKALRESSSRSIREESRIQSYRCED